MEENKHQNSSLITTCVNEDGKTCVTYIPLNIDISVVEFFIKNGGCTNKEARWFEVDSDEDTYWQEVWDNLRGENNNG